MKLTKDLYERLKKQKEEVLKELDEIKVQKEIARMAGDLSENSEYQDALVKMQDKYADYQAIASQLENVEIIEPILYFDTIEEGCKFKLISYIKGNELGMSNEQSSSGVFRYDPQSDMTVYTKDVTLIGTTNLFVTEGIIPIDSPVGKLLIGKQKGQYKQMIGGELVEYEVRQCQ